MGFFKRSNNSDNNENHKAPKGKVLAFLNQKGGVGKTTMAFNTAHALSEQGHKVLCIDMDPQANLSLLCGLDTDKEDFISIHQLLINSVRELKPLHVAALVQDCIHRGKRLDVIGSSQDLSGFELSVAGINSARQFILKKFIATQGLDETYDYIIIDGPPTLGLLVVNIMCAAEGLLVPFRPDEFSRKGLGHFYNVLEDIGDMGVIKAPSVVAHIPNLVDLRRKQESDDLHRIKEELESEFGVGCVTEPFMNRAPLVRSGAEKKSVFEFSSKEFGGLKRQFNDVANRITDWQKAEVQ